VAFGRQALRAVDEMMLLSALPMAQKMRPDVCSWDEVRQLASMLHRMAVRCAVRAGDEALLATLTSPYRCGEDG
jgi:hypothetical protein